MVSVKTWGQYGRLFTSDSELSSSLVNQIYQDRKGFIWIATYNGLDRYDGNNFQTFRVGQRPGLLLSNRVNCVLEDCDGRLLVGTDKGVVVYDESRNCFSDIPFVRGETVYDKGCHVLSMVLRRNGEVWVSTSGYGVFCLKPGATKAEGIGLFEGDGFVDYMAEGADGSMWLAVTNYGIYRWKDGIYHRYLADEAMLLGSCRLAFDRAGHLFVGAGLGGLFVFNVQKDGFERIGQITPTRYEILTLCPLSDGRILIGTNGNGALTYAFGDAALQPCDYYHPWANLEKAKIQHVLEDRDGNIWLGVFQKGVYMQPCLNNGFEYIGYKSGGRNLIGSACVLGVYGDRNGRLWVGTDRDGLYIVDLATYSVRHFASGCNGMPGTVACMTEDCDGNLWIGSYGNGAGRLDRETGRYEQLPFTREGSSVFVFKLLADGNGNLWVATLGDGLKKYNLRTHELTRYDVDFQASDSSVNSLTNSWLVDLCLSHDGKRLYIGMSSGLGCLDLETNSFVTAFGRNCVLHYVGIHALAEDAAGRLWVGSDKGLFFLDRQGNTLKQYTTHDGLADNYVSSLQFDDSGNLWVGTFRGLSMLDVEKGTFVNYYASSGLQGNEFCERTSCRADSLMVFGGTSGVTLFSPGMVRRMSARPDLLLVDMRIGNEDVTVDTKSGLFKVTDRPVTEADRFVLSYKDNSFSMRFSAMAYGMAAGVEYLYSMNDEPFVSMAGTNGLLTMNHLSPGNYRFKVKSVVNGQESDVKTFTVVVRPPWYAGWWAYCIYVLIFAGVVARIVRNNRLRQETRLRLQEHVHAEQVSEMKLQFFMNLNHEIRTPMTLIIGPLQTLLGTDFDEVRQRSYRIMLRNAERILAIINQILDLRKIDKGQMTMKMQPVNFVGFVKEVYELFDSQAREKNIGFHFDSDADDIEVWVDKIHFDKVVMNLLSNAFKFTPAGGNVGVRLTHDSHEVRLEVWDDGITIDADKKEKIFERFYQADNNVNQNSPGTGIGLNLTRQLVLLHHGTIEVANNADGKGCVFQVVLPLGNAHLKPEEIQNVESQPEPVKPEPLAAIPSVPEKPEIMEKGETVSHRKRIVVVEDDEEIRNYLRDELSMNYHVVTCANGKEALSEIIRTPPSLVLSDVMMPEMDGYTLCAKIKTNINMNFVPVVLLTAKTREEDKIGGLTVGADAYIEKPFNIKVLKYTISNLIGARDVLRNKVAQREVPVDKLDNVDLKTSDDKLMEKVMQVINENISNPYLSVEFIAQEVGISRSHLHRKMKELTNQGPRDLVRNIRLKRAADLLASGRRNISEVMYACGFENMGSFSVKFKNLFGVSPSAYMKEHQGKK